MIPPENKLGGNLDTEVVADGVLRHPPSLRERRASAKADTWHRLRRSVFTPTSPRVPSRRIDSQWIGALALLSFALLALLVRRDLLARRTDQTLRASVAGVPTDGWTEVDLGAAGRLFAAPAAAFHLPSPTTRSEQDFVIDLERGELCAQVAHRDPERQGRFVVATATLHATAIGTRFCVFAGTSPETTWIVVEEGLVRVDRADNPTLLAGTGTLVRGGAPHEALPSPGPTDPPELPGQSIARARSERSVAECRSARGPSGEENCLWRHASRSDLGAQNALYLLGTMARDESHDGPAALSIWRTYLERFPRGLFVAETYWAMFGELVAERRYPEALSVSDAFLQTSPSYFRVGELHIRRGDLLRGALDRPAEAQLAYRAALASEARPLLREQALYGLGASQDALGDVAGAQDTWGQYLRQFPQGPHAADVSRRLETQRH